MILHVAGPPYYYPATCNSQNSAYFRLNFNPRQCVIFLIINVEISII